ncbi:Tol-Pal system protein TolB [Neoehrlichia mikurensis]|uniref:Tol-Pal system protein TolB n=1 Tax=Neoehrlichia mikurensis TaxID=89586 RepID=A0A9Q9BYA1_9RICK|nr:Tol-Pal system beta propeller repeat protein TolB [Neoehrlichia mikurensis]QXK92176.1 Tol-Pal system protein TolB [Neoehrlichia mikurensis]QXK92631.1 Tol-Pal system protein TolB [Neoehrlichia mikurensis]QXK93870.1 Tol-Pal system protein TolB [Neoehrlichia mikurensis]UTO55134.1 Tol-Pal system beta propeller repeat protein TolB [Neoehrlichia mikurensis]UTO56054.1 Tol-Pal system beta propeller repeat protein TolB [Neoehrlichia mikurensis]
MFHRFLLLLFFLTALSAAPNKSYSKLKIDITRGNTENISIGIVPFHFTTNLENEIGQNIIKVIKNNLVNTGIFDVVTQYVNDLNINSEALPTSSLWKILKKDILITGSVKEDKQNKIEVKFRIWDIALSKELSGQSLTFIITNWRRAAHAVSDNIYHRLTGEDGYFNTKIVYIAETLSPRTRKIAIMDQDGENNIYLTSGYNFLSTPRFSPSGTDIVYMTYVKNKGKIIIKNLNTGSSTILGSFNGISSSPRFSPDGKSVLLSESIYGQTNIYSITVKDRKVSKLTDNKFINTSASYSPDKKFIVFNSDRNGSQQLYIMNADGKNQHRISFGKGRYATPVWSPRGDWIAFTKILSGNFYIGVIKPDGTSERLLAEGYIVEGPTWSPNGRIILFTQQDHPSAKSYLQSRLMSIDLTGINKKVINTPTNASSAHWSN